MAELKKLFVRVDKALGETATAAQVLAKSQSDPKKIFFFEKENTIYVNGIAYGMNPTQVARLEELERLMGESNTEGWASTDTIIARILDASSKIDILNDEVDALSAKDVEIDSSITALKAKDASIDASLAALVRKDASIDASLNALVAKDEEIDSSIDDLQSAVAELQAAPTVHLKEGEKVLSLGEGLELSSTIELSVDAEAGDDGKKYIRLTGKDGADLGKIDIADFVKDGMLKSVSLIDSSLHFVWNTDGDDTEIDVDLKKFIDTYTVKSGSEDYLDVQGYEVAVKIGEIVANAKGLADASSVAGAIAKVNEDNANKFAEIDSSIVSLKQHDTNLDSSVNMLEEAVEGLDGRLDVAEMDIDNLDASVRRLNTSVNNLEQKTADLDASIVVLKAKDNEIDASINRIDSSIVHIDSSIEDHESRLDAIEAWDPWVVVSEVSEWN